MSKFLATSAVYFRTAIFAVAANAAVITAAVITAGVGATFLVAKIVSEDQRFYNSCMIEHRSANYCRLIVSGR